MTVSEFILDRLGRMVLHMAFLFTVAVFLLITGTQPGIIILLVLVCLLIFLLVYLIYTVVAYISMKRNMLPE